MKISVLTPSFNSGKYILRAIQSVINQNYSDYEHIIVDGGSSDDTTTIVSEFPHIKYITEKDRGQSDAMNKAYKLSNGELIVYLNADDEFSENAFKIIVDAFKGNPNADMVVGDLIYKSPDATLTRVPSPKYKDILIYWKNLFPNNPVSYFYKRHVQDTVGLFPINEHFAMDMWFLLRAYKQFKVIKVNATLGTFHSDGNNKTAVTDAGVNLHKAVKQHLKEGNPIYRLYFYSMFIKNMFIK